MRKYPGNCFAKPEREAGESESLLTENLEIEADGVTTLPMSSNGDKGE